MNEIDAKIPQRTSKIGGISIISIAASASLQVGDRRSTNAVIRAIAVQEQKRTPSSEEEYFEAYPLFDYPLPDLNALLPEPQVEMKRTLYSDTIQVGKLDILAVSTAVSIIAGNSQTYKADSRVKHFRKFKPIMPGLPYKRPIQLDTRRI
ncbi:spore germination protein GerPE [Paenibacillus sp. IITD108]|uniref:spore germination protein GerPE n=1 Tax=Paenibacillus sp. IITD108 TaxID=3116649 RepID=UPI002F3E46DE